MLAADFDTESYRLFGRGYDNPKPAMQWYWDQYVPSKADRVHPYAVPLHGELHPPPAVVVIAGTTRCATRRWPMPPSWTQPACAWFAPTSTAPYTVS